jgi:lipid II:glycine glycyltransferase (peptidoglycan interpeptide bridge formation enzyme)
LLKTAIADACKRGFEVYNFGASMNLESVRKFKESFGAKRLDYPYYAIYGKSYANVQKAKSQVRRLANLVHGFRS